MIKTIKEAAMLLVSLTMLSISAYTLGTLQQIETLLDYMTFVYGFAGAILSGIGVMWYFFSVIAEVNTQ